MAIFLTVLQWIGILLLILLGLVLVLLFAPFFYTIEARGQGGGLKEMKLHGKLTFLLFVLRVRAEYPEGELYCVRLFGWPLFRSGEKAEDVKEETGASETVTEGNVTTDTITQETGASVTVTEGNVTQEETSPEPAVTQMDAENISPENEGNKTKTKKGSGFTSQLRGFCDKIKRMYEGLKAARELVFEQLPTVNFRNILHRAKKLLRCFRPRRIRAEGELGLSDAAKTGILFGFLSWIDHKGFMLTPDFENAGFTGSVRISGHFNLAVAGYHFLRLYFQPDTKKLIGIVSGFTRGKGI